MLAHEIKCIILVDYESEIWKQHIEDARCAGVEICDRNVGSMVFALKYVFGLIIGAQGDEKKNHVAFLKVLFKFPVSYEIILRISFP
jgi:hypothetical protein